MTAESSITSETPCHPPSWASPSRPDPAPSTHHHHAGTPATVRAPVEGIFPLVAGRLRLGGCSSTVQYSIAQDGDANVDTYKCTRRSVLPARGIAATLMGRHLEACRHGTRQTSSKHGARDLVSRYRGQRRPRWALELALDLERRAGGVCSQNRSTRSDYGC